MEEMEEKKQEPFDASRLSEKSQKLIEKINSLTEKIETEKSPLKKHMLAFRVKMLISRIQREIDINNIKDYYQDLRETSKQQKTDGEIVSLDNIAEITDKIKRLERELRGNEEYDAESQYFMYPAKFVEQSGGVDKLVQRLKQSEKPETKQAAQRIELMAQKRKELESLYEAKEKEQDALSDAQKGYKKQQIQYNIKEKAMIVREKVNIFSRISNFFKTMGEQAKLYIEEKKQDRELRNHQKEEEEKIEAKYREEIARLIEKQEQEIATSRNNAGIVGTIRAASERQETANELRKRLQVTTLEKPEQVGEITISQERPEETKTPEDEER